MRQNLQRVWLLALKDLKVFVADVKVLAFSLAFPLALIAFNTLTAGGGTASDPVMHLYVATEEPDGGLSHQIITTLEASSDISVEQVDHSAALRAVEDGELGAFLAFPTNFTEAIMAGFGTELTVYSRPEATRSQAALVGLGQQVALRAAAQRTVIDAVIALAITSVPSALSDPGRLQQVLSTSTPDGPTALGMVSERVGPIEPPEPSAWAVSGYVVMFLFFTAALGAENLVLERTNHTLERLVASGASRSVIVGGKLLGMSIRAAAQASVLWLAGIFVFGMEAAGSIGGIILVTAAFIFCASSISMTIAATAKTARAAGSAAVLASLILAPLGGSWWPLFIAPPWLQKLAMITPHAWANTSLNRLLIFGASLDDILPSVGVLLGFGLIFFIVAVTRFRIES